MSSNSTTWSADSLTAGSSSGGTLSSDLNVSGDLTVSGEITVGNLTITEGSDGASSRKLTVGNIEIDYDGTAGACGVLLFKEGDASFGTDRNWNIHQRKSSGNEGDFWFEYQVHDTTDFYQPFKISATAGDNALVIGANGNISIAGQFACNGQTPAAAPNWTVSNKTGTPRTLDANGTLAEIGDNLAQLVDDLISIGLLQ